MAKVVADYTPLPSNVPADIWPRVEQTVRRWATAAAPKNEGRAYEVLLPAAQYAAWLHTTGQPLDDGHALDWRVIDQWAASLAGTRTRDTIRNYRTLLRAVAKATPAAPVIPPAMKGVHRDRTGPYTPYETADLLGWADAVPCESGRRVRAIAVLAFGAGLDTPDLRTTLGTDVRRLPDGTVAIDVRGTRGRTTVALAEHAAEILALAEEAAGSWLYRPDYPSRTVHNLTNQSVDYARKKYPADVPFVVKRCRTTWIVRHLSAGTPIPVLAAAAGLAPRSLSDYIKHVQPPALTDDEAAALLRNARPLR